MHAQAFGYSCLGAQNDVRRVVFQAGGGGGAWEGRGAYHPAHDLATCSLPTYTQPSLPLPLLAKPSCA